MRAALLLAFVFLVGCADDRSTGPGVDAGLSASDAGATDAAPSAVDGGGVPGSDAGPGPWANDYFPLGVGLEWEWQATRIDGTPGTACESSGTHVSRIIEVREEAGGAVYVREENPGCYFDTLEYRTRAGGVDVNSGAWYAHLSLPPELGASWAAGGASGATYEWSAHHDEHTVAAGTFSDCWTRSQQGYDVWEIYCAGVGMVESHYAAWGGDSRMELTRTSF